MKKRTKVVNEGWLNAGREGQSRATADGLIVRIQRLRAKAEARVGDSAVDKLQWLVAFGQGDRERMDRDLKRAPLSSLAADVEVFASLTELIPMSLLHDPEAFRRAFAPRADAIMDAADRIGAGLRALTDPARGRSWKFEITVPIECRVFAEPSRSRKKSEKLDSVPVRVKTRIESDTAAPALLLEAGRILALEGHRLKTCAARNCDRLFVAAKGGNFCSVQHAKDEALREWRKRPKNREKLRKKAQETYRRRTSWR